MAETVMELHILDISIIVCYLAATIFVGFYISKRASKNLDSYFLGGKSLPWWVLGVSNASGMFDITGTMWLVYILFVYGLKSSWLCWVWPMFNQIFLMMYLAVWLRRSNVLTGAEWINTRFGSGRGANLAHISVVIFALVSVIGFLAYDFKGIGKFAQIFLPWDLSVTVPLGPLGAFAISSPDMYALIFMGITTLYVVKGGMFSVVLTEVFQFLVMTVAAVAVGVIAISRVSPDALARVVPEGWKSIFFGWRLDLDWTDHLASVNQRIADDGYSLFTIFFMLMMFKGILVSMAGPAPNYDMQRILATRSPREAGLMSGFVNIALFFPRYMMIAGLTVLALVFFRTEMAAMGDNIDFEQILPFAIKNFIPIGLMGVLIAGLLSAFMSTFAATVNAAPAYIVNDIYKRFINPNASDRKYVRISRWATLAVIVTGIGFGFVVESINQITLWIVSALWGGYAASNFLKWYWWRFNGYGFFWGMISGIVAALVVPVVFPEMEAIHSFFVIFPLSLVGCILGTLLSGEQDQAVLKRFYRTVRPWGLWKPIVEAVRAEEPGFQGNRAMTRDWVNVLVGLVWQVSLIATPIYLVIQEWNMVAAGAASIAVTSYFLKKNWYDRLERE